MKGLIGPAATIRVRFVAPAAVALVALTGWSCGLSPGADDGRGAPDTRELDVRASNEDPPNNDNAAPRLPDSSKRLRSEGALTGAPTSEESVESAATIEVSHYRFSGSAWGTRLSFRQDVEMPEFFRKTWDGERFDLTFDGEVDRSARARGEGREADYYNELYGLNLKFTDAAMARMKGVWITVPNQGEDGFAGTTTFGLPVAEPLSWADLAVGSETVGESATGVFAVNIERTSGSRWDISWKPTREQEGFAFNREGGLSIDLGGRDGTPVVIDLSVETDRGAFHVDGQLEKT